MITASVVIYNTNQEDFLRLIQCVQASSISKIYFIDNSPINIYENKLTYLTNKDYEYIWGHGNIGYGAGHNIALKKAIEQDSKYHIILNPDIIFKVGTIENITSFMDTYSDVGLLLPKVIYPNGSLQYLCKLLPTPFDIFGRRFLPISWLKKRNYKYEMHEMGYDKIWNCPILSGCFMFLRIDVVNKTGLFDNRFFMYFEDFDLIRRIHHISKTVFYPKVTIIHAHAAEHRNNYYLLKESIKSAVKYFNKWGWFFDFDRRNINKNALNESNYIIEK